MKKKELGMKKPTAEPRNVEGKMTENKGRKK
jgi:hypothetical protein